MQSAEQWVSLLGDSSRPVFFSDPEMTDDIQKTLAFLKNVLGLEAAEQKINAISTWPFDTTVLGKLAAIILSILVALTSKMLINILGL